MARRSASRSIAPERFRSAVPTSRLSDGDSADNGSSSESTGDDLRLPQLHQHGVHRDPLEPSGKGGVAAERLDIAKHLEEGFLSQVFGVGHILGHLQACRVNPLLMQLEERGESFLIAPLRALNEAAFGMISLSSNSRWIRSAAVAEITHVASVEKERSGPLPRFPSGRSCN